MKSITLNVTADDIARGTPCSAGTCAIALAARRAFVAAGIPHDVNLTVSNRFVYSTGSGGSVRYALPERADLFIWQFDKDRTKCQPCSFELDLTNCA